MEVICYFSIAIVLCLLSLFLYGVSKTSSHSLDEDDLLGMLIMSLVWPIAIAIIILYGVFYLPIMLGEHVGELIEKDKAKKEFKEVINKRK